MALLFGILWRALTNIKTLRDVHDLLKFPPLAETVQNNPKFEFKYLTENYLAQCLTVAERASCFSHHYRRLVILVPDRILRQILHWDLTLCEFSEGKNHFALTLGQSRPSDKEGELSINVKIDGNIVFVLSFTIVPGCVVKSAATESLLITRLQGTPGCYRHIRRVTKACCDVGPSALLLAALQGFADALQIGEIAAVNATNQSSYCEELDVRFKSAYDDFFAELLMDRTANGFFCSSVPIEEKPLGSIKHGHKLRTKEKRAFKQRVRVACSDCLQQVINQACECPNQLCAIPTANAPEAIAHSVQFHTANETLLPR